jgi:shikimate dehydrogenase
VGFSLALAGARRLSFYDVDKDKAGALALEIRTRTGADAQALAPEALADAAAAADCLINATPLGLKRSDPLPLGRGNIRKQHLVCDLVYNPLETKFLKAAKERGAGRLPGIGMLLYQGVIAFELWTGAAAPVPVMKKALARQIAAIA